MSDPASRGLFPGRPGRTLRAAAVLAVFLALFILVDRLSGPREPGRPPQAGSATTNAPPTSAAAPTTSATTTTAPPTTTTRAPATTTTAARPTTTRAQATAAPIKPADGVTVQILNGTGELRLARDFKPQVREAGYRIVNTGNSAAFYPTSTVYYTDDNRDDALSFRRRFPAFRNVAKAPPNLSSQVELHVIIGANFDP